MDGKPVWLASVSRRDHATARIIPTREWITRPALKNKALRILKEILSGVGDSAYQTLFRMNATLCIHRALTDEEVAGLPGWWHEAPAVGMAGPSVEVLYSRGASGRPAQRPCLNPRKTLPPMPGYDPSLWIPEGCGQCEPCKDRQAAPSSACLPAIEAKRGERTQAHEPRLAHSQPSPIPPS